MTGKPWHNIWVSAGQLYGGAYELLNSSPKDTISNRFQTSFAVQQSLFIQKIEKRITISIRISTYDPNQHREVSALIDAADTALYKAKQQGRNQAYLGFPA
ncbi:MAG: diguanylate cyclase domain-containing protein [Candidatus Aquirickettsiella gammari]